mmetsp:Transcript_29436/g.70580  ORF Transcript_29436/g.70580 Transcript_29436/m.70580 type:complete len:210 (+) Transcript_29436:769-1398(+)
MAHTTVSRCWWNSVNRCCMNEYSPCFNGGLQYLGSAEAGSINSAILANVVVHFWRETVSFPRALIAFCLASTSSCCLLTFSSWDFSSSVGSASFNPAFSFAASASSFVSGRFQYTACLHTRLAYFWEKVIALCLVSLSNLDARFAIFRSTTVMIATPITALIIFCSSPCCTDGSKSSTPSRNGAVGTIADPAYPTVKQATNAEPDTSAT